MTLQNTEDHPALINAIRKLRDQFLNFVVNRKYGNVSITVNFEAGRPIVIEELSRDTDKAVTAA